MHNRIIIPASHIGTMFYLSLVLDICIWLAFKSLKGPWALAALRGIWPPQVQPRGEKNNQLVHTSGYRPEAGKPEKLVHTLGYRHEAGEPEKLVHTSGYKLEA